MTEHKILRIHMDTGPAVTVVEFDALEHGLREAAEKDGMTTDDALAKFAAAILFPNESGPLRITNRATGNVEFISLERIIRVEIAATDDPELIIDRDRDVWARRADGTYVHVSDQDYVDAERIAQELARSTSGNSLEHVEKMWGPVRAFTLPAPGGAP